MTAKSADSTEMPINLFGPVSAMGQAVAFGAVGVIALESLAYGAIVGAMSGLGAYLFVPWFLQLAAAQEDGEEKLPLADAIRQVPGRPKWSAFGLGLELGAIVALAIGFSTDEPNLLVGAAGGLSVALLVYLVGSLAIDRLLDSDD